MTSKSFKTQFSNLVHVKTIYQSSTDAWSYLHCLSCVIRSNLIQSLNSDACCSSYLMSSLQANSVATLYSLPGCHSVLAMAPLHNWTSPTVSLQTSSSHWRERTDETSSSQEHTCTDDNSSHWHERNDETSRSQEHTCTDDNSKRRNCSPLNFLFNDVYIAWYRKAFLS